MWKQTPPQKMAGSEQKKINQTKKKKNPTQIQDVITKITVPPRIQALYHSLSHSSELNYCSNHEAPRISPALLPVALPDS